MFDPRMAIRDPYVLIQSMEECWKCSASAPVATFGLRIPDTEYDDGGTFIAVYQYVESLTAQCVDAVRQHQPLYRVHRSGGRRRAYYTNFCGCGANFGDYFLNEWGHAFDPTSDKDITLRYLPTALQGFVHNDLVDAEHSVIARTFLFPEPVAW